ncbi:putative F-box/FBD/LRR-repeat protein At5g44950 [Ipomoea triloba]|uniref:putative F-box/FBD/LRR-repeat protein At5g44950 n=1 Tax=Ipomoea triloba TaxID=35885 RepID=UPI00125D3990|nr:putative F-box/FBD/LRR-repeat protein At5g44950 [Ipomoea triloba]
MAGRDRISELPFDIIDKILRFLLIEEVARMAVLSTFWKDIWFSLTHLNFDAKFLKHIEKKYSHAHNDNRTKNMKKKRRINDIWTSAGLHVINKVLIQHNGFINKFVIDFSHTPRNTLRSRSFDIDQWLLLVTQKGVEEINISLRPENEYSLPNCIFSCPSLKILHIYGVSIKPINAQCTLPNVTSLQFQDVNFDGGDLLVDVPMLNSLSFIGCKNMTTFNIAAKKLDHLAILDCSFYEFSDNLELRYFRSLELDNSSIKDFVYEFIRRTRLPLRQHALNVQHLTISTKEELSSLDNDDEMRIGVSAFMYLLQICPHLRIFDVDLSFSEILPKLPELLHIVRHGYKMLRILELQEFAGFQRQILFIKELLACSPILEKVVINRGRVTNIYFENNKEEILHFHRASTKVEIIFR